MRSESDFDGDDDNEQTGLFLTFYILPYFYWNIIIYLGRTSPINENLSNSVQNHPPSNQTDVDDG